MRFLASMAYIHSSNVKSFQDTAHVVPARAYIVLTEL
jgi:hypothetical protein